MLLFQVEDPSSGENCRILAPLQKARIEDVPLPVLEEGDAEQLHVSKEQFAKLRDQFQDVAIAKCLRHDKSNSKAVKSMVWILDQKGKAPSQCPNAFPFVLQNGNLSVTVAEARISFMNHSDDPMYVVVHQRDWTGELQGLVSPLQDISLMGSDFTPGIIFDALLGQVADADTSSQPMPLNDELNGNIDNESFCVIEAYWWSAKDNRPIGDRRHLLALHQVSGGHLQLTPLQLPIP